MLETDSLARPRAAPLDLAFNAFHRVAAIICFYIGILYWIRLVGIHSGADWRFDLMPLHWQMASVALSVMFPFAAVGLWLVASWGPVIWFVCAVTEIVMYGVYPEHFGRHYAAIAIHLAIGLAYLVLRILLALRARRLARAA